MPTATEGAYHPHPVAPLPKGEGRILPVITAPFFTPLPAGEGAGGEEYLILRGTGHRLAATGRHLFEPLP
jgi:hypothetical protein